MLVRIPPVLQPRDGHAPALQADQLAAGISKCCKLARRANAPARLPRLRRRSTYNDDSTPPPYSSLVAKQLHPMTNAL